MRPTGMGERPDDRRSLPLCGRCHRNQHKRGEGLFWAGVGIDPHELISALNYHAGDSQAAEDLMEARRELRTGTLATT